MRHLWVVALALGMLVGCGQASLPKLPGKLAFVSDRFEAKPGDPLSAKGVCVLDGGRIRKLYGDTNFPRWSKDGKRLYCKNMGNGEDIFVFSYPAGKLIRKYDLSHRSWAFALLPDESGLIYVGWDTSYTAAKKEMRSPENLYEYSFATGRERRLTDFPVAEWGALTRVDVSPDGRWITFTRAHPEPEEGIYLLERDTGQLQKLFQGRSSRFTPDGRVLFVSHLLKGEHMKTAEVFIYDPKTEDTKRLTQNGENDLEFSPVMSPDGRHIAYEIRVFAGGEKASGLYVINADGTHERRILGHDGHVYLTPDWAP